MSSSMVHIQRWCWCRCRCFDWCHLSRQSHRIVQEWKKPHLSLSQGHRRDQMAVSWVEVQILRLMKPGISSACCRPRFLSWSLWGEDGSFTDPDSTTWPMNSSFTALLFHTWGRAVSFTCCSFSSPLSSVCSSYCRLPKVRNILIMLIFRFIVLCWVTTRIYL